MKPLCFSCDKEIKNNYKEINISPYVSNFFGMMMPEQSVFYIHFCSRICWWKFKLYNLRIIR